MSVSSIEVNLIEQGLATQYSVAAALTFLIYDYSITLDTELTYIWKNPAGNSPWTWLFFLNRYVGLLSVTFEAIGILTDFGGRDITEVCTIFYWWEALWGILSLLIVEVILQTKIYIVYNRSRTLLKVLIPLFILSAAATFVFFIIFVLNIKTPNIPKNIVEDFRDNFGKLGPLKGCFTIGGSYPFWVWLPVLTFETFLCLLMVLKVCEIYRVDWRSPLLKTIVVDSILYFLPVFGLLLGSSLLWGIEGKHLNNLVELTGPWVTVIASALGSRLLLNIREEFSKGRSRVDSSELIPLTTV
ncbi:hypothetical protein M422DRAFT_784498 [Sphaerobolus stellatus SS14]|uniref:DUF6533 domain-containing protein n=1 Tax=Sphaerobolus stellatus (strain SS14) TaxID=990650 RepID=A0A0C9UTV7_SPHS4|nr:hypothetical protein M422DRAFT_784498 [Sphaerobolus stellatus SS14]